MTDRLLPAAAGEPLDPTPSDMGVSLPAMDETGAGGDGGEQDAATPAGDPSSTDTGSDPIAPPDAVPVSDQPTLSFSPRPAETAAPRAHDAMRILSRMQTDLDLVTEGKRAATYDEVDTAFDKAVTALGIKLPGAAGAARTEVPVAQGTALGVSAGAEASPGGSSGDTGADATTQGSNSDWASEHLASADPVTDGAADAFSALLAKSPGPAGASRASLVRPAGKKKGAKRGPAAMLWPKLPDQRSVQLARDWPIPGDHHFAVDKATGSNGLTFSDGRYAPEGGYRGKDPKTKKPRKHKGIDIPATTRDPVGAAADGTVLQSSWQKDWGNYVAIRHPDGYVTLYAHLDTRAKLKIGEAVTRGAQVGTVGNTGNAKDKGTHLHFEVRVYNGDSTLAAGSRTVDPEAWLKGELHEPGEGSTP